MNEYTFERINHTFDTNEMDLVLVTVHKVFFSFTHPSSTMDSRYKRYSTKLVILVGVDDLTWIFEI